MNNENIRFRAGPLPEDFIQVLAKFGHTTVSKIKQMVATCILCGQECDGNFRKNIRQHRTRFA